MHVLPRDGILSARVLCIVEFVLVCPSEMQIVTILMGMLASLAIMQTRSGRSRDILVLRPSLWKIGRVNARFIHSSTKFKQDSPTCGAVLAHVR